MQAVAAELSGYAGNSAAFLERKFQTVCSIHLFSNGPSTISLRSLAVHETGVRQDMVLGFLARNELVASVLALFLRASRYPGSAANLLGSREQQRVATAVANKRDVRLP